jgi:hypothetical protein
MRDPRYYIKLPASPSQGIKGGYYPVDPATLRLSILMQLYRRNDRGYDRDYGIEPSIELDNDPSPLLQRWSDLMDQIEQLMPDSGLVGDFAQELRGALDGLPQLIQLTAAGKLSDAAGAVDAIGDGLVALAATVIDTYSTLETKAMEHGEHDQAMTEVVAGGTQEGLYQAMAESLADSVDQGLSAYRQLAEFESAIDDLIRGLEPLNQMLSPYVQSGPSWLSEQLAWLGDDGGYCTQASRFLIRPRSDAVDLMVVVIGQARTRLQQIADRLATAASQHAEAKNKAQSILEQQFQVDSLIRTMRDTRDAVKKLAQTGIDPFAIVGGLITEDEFAAWQGLLADPDWKSLHAVGMRLREKAQLVRQMLDQEPLLTPTDEKTLERVRQYIDRVELAMAELGRPAPAATEPAKPVPAASTVRAPGASRTAAPRGVDQARIDVLYDLMMAVGAVKYCGAANLTGGTPRAILDILEALGRITPAERDLYSAPLRQCLEGDSYEVQDGESRLTAWRTTDPARHRWIQFRQGRGGSPRRFLFWRLVEQGRPAALALCEKYGLSQADIVRAYDDRRAAREQARR